MAELWRYPVKSMQGESIPTLEVLSDGIRFDRRYAFVSSGAPAGKPRLTSRERAAMLRFSAYVQNGEVCVRTPEGREFAIADPALLRYMEEHLPQGNRIHLEHEPGGPPCTDVRPVALHSTAGLRGVNAGFGREVDARRFRSNLVLEMSSEFGLEPDGESDPLTSPDLTGRVLRVGSAELRLLERIPRCRMVTLDPETADAAPELMKYLDRHHGGRLGVYAAVHRPGTIAVGDAVWVAEG